MRPTSDSMSDVLLSLYLLHENLAMYLQSSKHYNTMDLCIGFFVFYFMFLDRFL